MHENVISLLDCFRALSPGADEQDVYIVTELMGSDLHAIISSQSVSNEHVQFLTYQILRALVVSGCGKTEGEVEGGRKECSAS